jgi:hypothetical protein
VRRGRSQRPTRAQTVRPTVHPPGATWRGSARATAPCSRPRRRCSAGWARPGLPPRARPTPPPPRNAQHRGARRDAALCSAFSGDGGGRASPPTRAAWGRRPAGGAGRVTPRLRPTRRAPENQDPGDRRERRASRRRPSRRHHPLRQPVGFTGLAERRDPEETVELLDECFLVQQHEITHRSGWVETYIGDEVMANVESVPKRRQRPCPPTCAAPRPCARRSPPRGPTRASRRWGQIGRRPR